MELKLVCGRSNRPLAEAISRELAMLGTKSEVMVPCITSSFGDGEKFAQFPDNIRRSDVFIIQSTQQPDGNWMELFIMLNAAKLASAGEITAVIPYFGYARQDRKVKPRVPISAKLMANLLERAGAQRVLVSDFHAGQIQGFFDCPTDNLESLPVLLRALHHDEAMDFREVVLVSPDKGGVDRCSEVGKLVHCGNVTFIRKRRPTPGVAKVHGIENATLVRGKTCILLDDIVDGGGTIVKAAEALMEAGAARVFGLIVHPVLSVDAETGMRAVDRIAASPLVRLYVSDTIPIPAPVPEKIRVVSIGSLLARAIYAIHTGDSVHGLFPKIGQEIFE